MVSVDLICSTKKTPIIIDMATDTMVDMLNADCVHSRWLDALCPIFILFDAYSRSFYECKVVHDQVIILMSVSKATHDI